MDTMTKRPDKLSWHQIRGAQRALGLHRWMALDESTLCITCGLEVPGDPDDHDTGKCPGFDAEGVDR